MKLRLLNKPVLHCLLVLGIILLNACATQQEPGVENLPIDYSLLPEPNVSLNIEGLGPCNSQADRSLKLSSNEPVTILVHGCFGSAGRFRTLSDVLAFHGQQSACFSYDDRDSMMKSSAQLSRAVESLSEKLNAQKITVIGHSQGGLVARKALIADRESPIEPSVKLNLVTVSAPFSGIRSAKLCGVPFIRFATLGLHDVVCRMVSGAKWHEITDASSFIKKPGALSSSVDRYLLVKTDERETCRQYDSGGKCVKDDFVFSLDEQQLPQVFSNLAPNTIEVAAGHVEIVGESGVTPRKLIRILQAEGYIRETQLSRRGEFDTLLAQLYSKTKSRSTIAK